MMMMAMRLMMAAVVLTVALMLARAAGYELTWSTDLMVIRYRMTPNTMAKVTVI